MKRDKERKNLGHKPSTLELGAALAIRINRRLFPQPEEIRSLALVTLKTTKKGFLLWERVLRRNAHLSPGRYQEISQNPSLEDISRDEWEQFIKNQDRALILLKTKTDKALFENLPMKPEGWFEFEDAETQISVMIDPARDLASGLYASFCEIALEIPTLEEHYPERQVEAAKIMKDILLNMAGVVGQLQEQGIPVEPEGAKNLQREAKRLRDSGSSILPPTSFQIYQES